MRWQQRRRVIAFACVRGLHAKGVDDVDLIGEPRLQLTQSGFLCPWARQPLKSELMDEHPRMVCASANNTAVCRSDLIRQFELAFGIDYFQPTRRRNPRVQRLHLDDPEG